VTAAGFMGLHGAGLAASPMSPNEIDPLTQAPAAAPTPITAAPELQPEPKPVRAKPRHEPLYFVVILLLIADIMLGLGIAVFAEKVMDFRPMAVGGLGLAGLGLGILAYFVLFGSGRPKK
jgi:hypothetical protein